MVIKFRQLVAPKKDDLLTTNSQVANYVISILSYGWKKTFYRDCVQQIRKARRFRAFNSIKKFKGFDYVTIVRSRDFLQLWSST